MKPDLENLKNRLAAKLQIRTSNETIRQARNIMNAPTQAALNLPLLHFIQSRPWAISQAGLRKLASHVNSALAIEFSDFFELRPETKILPDGTALIHVHSALVDTCPAIYEKLGIVTRYSTIAADIRDVTTKGAKSIVLVVDSPGGTVAGIPETVEVIAKSAIPIRSFCTGLACSAAYHLIAGTKRIVATPSATVGNIGTILSWADDTEFWQAMGIEWKALVNEGADLKSTGHLEPDETQLAFLQESINESGKAFREHVQKSRPGINAEVFRAGWYSGEKAKALGLTDEIGTLENAISKVSTPQKKQAMTSTSPAPELKPTARTVVNPPAVKPEPVASNKQDFSGLSGLDLATAIHKAEVAAKPAPPAQSFPPEMQALTGIDRATAYHQATAPNPAPKSSGKASTPRPDVSNLSGLAKAQAIAKWEAEQKQGR